MVLLESLAGVADRANHAEAQIAETADEIDQPLVDRIVEHAANSKIAALRIFFDRAEVDRRRTTAIDIRRIGAESCDLEVLAAEQDFDYAELCADRDGIVEKALHDL